MSTLGYTRQKRDREAARTERKVAKLLERSDRHIGHQSPVDPTVEQSPASKSAVDAAGDRFSIAELPGYPQPDKATQSNPHVEGSPL